MKFEIKNRWTGAVQYTCELSAEVAGQSYGLQLGFAVKKALAEGANLSDADLRAANLRAANLSAADLRAANLSAADLSAADLSDADLRAANLRAANLSDANLSDADLSAANLRDADLSAANLSAADLSAADLSDANLSAANLRAADLRAANLSAAVLTPIRDDVWAVLSSAPAEAAAVRDALAAGKVNGSTYEGPCACLVGTIAQARHVPYNSVDGLRPASWRPAERFFMAINEGDTPETSQACAIAHGWVSEWIARMEAAFAPAAA